ncbi:DUF3244 domain-containing protein [Xylanibacter muris]|uniref:DUF3244 domain-containing protein n=3 Tax=Xylanibacter muris TaxID=2736290 RepID=A0ABX2AN01_9BACT|nr:DUF3244 domain-containing protein [Xylanibacter muris]NPD92601.1 DUF3244 domain-containing protein [Xylanibacter muris]
MNSRLFIVFVFLLIFPCPFVIAGIVVLDNDENELSRDRHVEIPVVSFNDSILTVSSDSIINNVEVVIKDRSGNAVYSVTVDAVPDGSSVSLPGSFENRGYTLELCYDGNYLYGHIE